MLPEENTPTAAIRTLKWGFLSMETKKRSIPDLQATIENIGHGTLAVSVIGGTGKNSGLFLQQSAG